MPKARNGVRYSEALKQEARALRSKGFTHREIAREVGAQVSTIFIWTQGVVITPEQKTAIEGRRKKSVHRMTAKEKREALRRLRPYMFKPRYSGEDLIDRIRKFYFENGRIPLKREFNSFRTYKHRFKSWNEAIKRAGFDTNPVLFAKRLPAKDGHFCDSFTEKIIDDWLSSKNIPHERQYRYGNTKLTADFRLDKDTLIEFFGLAGTHQKYDDNIARKRNLAKDMGLRLIEVYPKDVYPKNKLEAILQAAGIMKK